MKKAKIMLSAIAILAVLGGALAFKATKFSAANVYCDNTCTDANKKLYTTNFIQGAAFSTTPCGAHNTIYYFDGSQCTTYTTQPATSKKVYQVSDL